MMTANIRLANRGASLIEVLLALLIFSVGLLGFSSLQSHGQKAEMESYQRVHAINLLAYMSNHIRQNPIGAECYALSNGTGSPAFVGTGYTDNYACSAYGTSVTQAEITAGVNAWDEMLKGSNETIGGASVGGLLNARGCISLDAATDVYTITVIWQAVTEVAYLSKPNCAAAEYGISNTTDNYSVRTMTQEVILADYGL